MLPTERRWERRTGERIVDSYALISLGKRSEEMLSQGLYP